MSVDRINTSPTVSVIIPCRNEVASIDKSLRSVLSQQRPSQQLEVIVADGMSDDGTRSVLEAIARDHPELRVIDNPAQIASTGLNAAIGVAKGQVIVRMDAHTDYAPDYVCQSLAVLEESCADAVGGPWVGRGIHPVARAVAAVFRSPFCAGTARGHDPTYAGPIDTVYLGCWRREIFDRLGLFDEELARNEDDEFSLRIIRSGGTIFQSPRIRSWYTPRGSLKALLHQYAQYGYWKVRVIQKHRLPASPRHLVPAFSILLFAVLSIASAWSASARRAAMALAAAYIVGNVLASADTARRSEWKLWPLMPVVFACYHIGYAAGFLHGVWDFAILRRQPRRAYTALTRNSPL
jgi:glycosyltransferase involved in cell wall biosynthesis